MTEALEYFTLPDEIDEDFNTILYVDDEESNLRVFDSVFSRYFNIYTANNGNTGIKMLREYDIHMIITDQKMPEMTGTDLLEKILGEFPDIIRIILTGFSDIQAIIKAINKCSIYKYITKPYENSEMREIIDNGMKIYNMRKEKYSSSEKQNDEAVNGHSNGANGLALAEPSDNQIANLDIMSQHMVADLTPSEEDFDGYFDFHIDYHMPQETFSEIHSDFVVHTDDDGSQLFFVSMKTSSNEGGALAYLHMKAKLRSVLEAEGNAVDLFSLKNELTAIYDEVDVPFKPDGFKIVTYNWDAGVFQYLTTERNIKLFAVGQQLEPLSLQEVESEESGYKRYSVSSEKDLVVYFWDFILSEEGNPYESPNYFKQIVNNATNMPFDLQASQVASGIKSVAQHFTDAALFGLYLND